MALILLEWNSFFVMKSDISERYFSGNSVVSGNGVYIDMVFTFGVVNSDGELTVPSFVGLGWTSDTIVDGLG